MKKILILTLMMVFAFGTSSLLASSYEKKSSVKGSSSMEEGKIEDGINGFCPICIFKGKYMAGNDNFITTYKGKRYKFVGIDQQKKFIDDPEKYVAGLEQKYKELKDAAMSGQEMKGSH